MKKKCPILFIALTLTLSVFFDTVSASDSLSADRVTLPIIMYHEVKYDKLGKDVISPWDFESDLKYLQKNNYTTITMSELLGYFDDGSSLPEKPVILSFDDGYLNNYKYVLPLLKKYDMKIVLSLIVKDTDDFSNIPDNNIDYAHVTWRQLNEMLDTGLVEVQNHSYALHKLTSSRHGCTPKKGEPLSKYEALFKIDTLKAQNKIYTMTGCLPAVYSYPYGSYCDITDIILKELGIRATLSCRYGINELSKSNPDGLFRLKRLCRSHNQNLSKLLDDANKTIKKKPPAQPCGKRLIY